MVIVRGSVPSGWKAESWTSARRSLPPSVYLSFRLKKKNTVEDISQGLRFARASLFVYLFLNTVSSNK